MLPGSALVADAQPGELLVELGHLAAGVHHALHAGPGRMRLRVHVQAERVALLAVAGAGGELGQPLRLTRSGGVGTVGSGATFGDRLANAREATGLSQREVAQRLGVKEKTIRDWEDDLSEPRASRLQTLAGMLGVSLMWLLSGQGEGVSPPDPEAEPEDIGAMLVDLRQARSETERLAHRIGVIEKRLRRWSHEARP